MFLCRTLTGNKMSGQDGGWFDAECLDKEEDDEQPLDVLHAEDDLNFLEMFI